MHAVDYITCLECLPRVRVWVRSSITKLLELGPSILCAAVHLSIHPSQRGRLLRCELWFRNTFWRRQHQFLCLCIAFHVLDKESRNEPFSMSDVCVAIVGNTPMCTVLDRTYIYMHPHR